MEVKNCLCCCPGNVSWLTLKCHRTRVCCAKTDEIVEVVEIDVLLRPRSRRAVWRQPNGTRFREGEAPAEPFGHSMSNVSPGSAGASPSQITSFDSKSSGIRRQPIGTPAICPSTVQFQRTGKLTHAARPNVLPRATRLWTCSSNRAMPSYRP